MINCTPLYEGLPLFFETLSSTSPKKRTKARRILRLFLHFFGLPGRLWMCFRPTMIRSGRACIIIEAHKKSGLSSSFFPLKSQLSNSCSASLRKKPKNSPKALLFLKRKKFNAFLRGLATLFDTPSAIAFQTPRKKTAVANLESSNLHY